MELQSLPTRRLRRPDTESGQRAPMTGHSESTRTPSRDPVPEHGTKPAKAPKKPPSPWIDLSLSLACYTSFQILLAISLGGAPSLSVFSDVVFIASVGVVAWKFLIDIALAWNELKNEYIS